MARISLVFISAELSSRVYDLHMYFINKVIPTLHVVVDIQHTHTSRLYSDQIKKLQEKSGKKKTSMFEENCDNMKITKSKSTLKKKLNDLTCFTRYP